jgi:hypothetical protein
MFSVCPVNGIIPSPWATLGHLTKCLSPGVGHLTYEIGYFTVPCAILKGS